MAVVGINRVISHKAPGTLPEINKRANKVNADHAWLICLDRPVRWNAPRGQKWFIPPLSSVVVGTLPLTR